MDIGTLRIEKTIPRQTEYRRLVESMRVMLAIIAGSMMLGVRPEVQHGLSMGVLGFSVYAVVLLWLAATGSANVQRRIFYWLDAFWFLLLLFLSGEANTHYFLLLFFPVFFAAWRTGYRESILIAAFSGLAALAILAARQPDLPWARLFALPLSLFIVGPLFVALARVEAITREHREFAAGIVENIDIRRGFDGIVPELMARLAARVSASAALLAVRTVEGRCRVFGWDAEEGSFELSESVASPVVDQALSLPDGVAAGWKQGRHRWNFNGQIEIGPGGLPPASEPLARGTLLSLAGLVGGDRLLTVPLAGTGIGQMRLLFGGEAIDVNLCLLGMLQFVVEQIAPSVENAGLREQLAAEARLKGPSRQPPSRFPSADETRRRPCCIRAPARRVPRRAPAIPA